MNLDPQFSVWLNRIGIVLNFLAGFLLAPELLGVERLQNIEQSITKQIEAAYIVRDRLIAQLETSLVEAETINAESRARIKARRPAPARRSLRTLSRVGEITIVALGIFGFALPFRVVVVLLEHVRNIKGLLVWWGIVFFILGNFIQLVATFG